MSALNGFWGGRKYYLNRMSLGELIAAYFQYPAIQAYIVLLGVSLILTFHWGGGLLSLSLSVVLVLVTYPLIWYLLHRFVLHSRILYRSPQTAVLWKRIHYDHHQDPNDLGILFGALYTTLPTIAVITLPVGGLIGGLAGAAAAFAAGLASTLFYEFCHCIQHLRYKPRNRFLRRIKRLHLLHHFHNENGNYGITNFLWDRLTGTFYQSANEMPHSETVFNLGYKAEERDRYPWVARLSEERPDTASHPAPAGKESCHTP